MFNRSFSKRKFHHNGNFHSKRRRVNGGNRRKKSVIDPTKYINKAAVSPIENNLPVKNSFNDFPIDQVLKQNILNRGYTLPTPIQDQAIPHILAGMDVVGIANTGT